jgi:hypothetical protein
MDADGEKKKKINREKRRGEENGTESTTERADAKAMEGKHKEHTEGKQGHLAAKERKEHKGGKRRIRRN